MDFGGKKLGPHLSFFLLGADIYTAYIFVAVPSGVFAKGSLYFFNFLMSLTFRSGSCYYAKTLDFVESKRIHYCF